MITHYYLKLILQNFSSLYLAILMAFILTDWLIELSNYQPRTNDSSPLRSHFFISLFKYLTKHKIEIIIFTLAILLILSIYFFDYLESALIRLLSLGFKLYFRFLSSVVSRFVVLEKSLASLFILSGNLFIIPNLL